MAKLIKYSELPPQPPCPAPPKEGEDNEAYMEKFRAAMDEWKSHPTVLAFREQEERIEAEIKTFGEETAVRGCPLCLGENIRCLSTSGLGKMWCDDCKVVFAVIIRAGSREWVDSLEQYIGKEEGRE